MHLGEPSKKNAKRAVWGIFGFLGILFIFFFWQEIRQVLGFSLLPNELAYSSRSFIILLSNCVFGFLFVFFLSLVLLAFQAVLPVSNLLQDPLTCLMEVYRTCWHLLFYFLHLHGPAIFVENGKANDTSEDWKHEGPGVVVVNMNSAVVLEERNPPPGMSGALDRIKMLLMEGLWISDGRESPRVRGPGIVFTRKRERIREAVDLRRHFRILPKARCYTRDGIELSANVFSVFTIGQDPDILQVTYIGEQRPENLRVVSFEPVHGNLLYVNRISSDPQEIDPEDRREIHEFAMRFLSAYTRWRGSSAYPLLPDQSQLGQGSPRLLQYTPLPDTSAQWFNRDRVFAATFAHAHTSSQEQIPWTELPARVAVGCFREILSQVNYDALYNLKGVGGFPLPQFKSKMRLALRNNGILSYRLVLCCDGEEMREKAPLDSQRLVVSQIMPLANSKMLRDRGIKALFASFSDPIPVNEAIYQQRLDYWRAAWEREQDLSMASRELKAMRERGRAHAEAQQDLWYSLSQLFQTTEHSDEALALRIMQSLENAAADPRTRALLPDSTLSLMRQIHALLQPMDPNLTGFLGSGGSLPPGGRV